MRIVVISGSRNPEGQTARATTALVNGAAAEGAVIDQHYLPALRLERCRQCNADGWGDCRAKGACIVDDDFAMLVEAVRGADAVVFATPVYFSDLSESLRAFMDRLRRICRHDDGKRGIAGKATFFLCVAGGGGGGAPLCAGHFESIARNIGLNLVDSALARRQNLEMKLPLLHATGRWLATSATE